MNLGIFSSSSGASRKSSVTTASAVVTSPRLSAGATRATSAQNYRCQYCSGALSWRSAADFSSHLRACHATREGGSFVCKYGPRNICHSLPLEGVSDVDYEQHVIREHVRQAQIENTRGHNTDRRMLSLEPSSSSLLSKQPEIVRDNIEQWTVYNSSINLPAILNDPRKSRRENNSFFTRHWGDIFTDKATIYESVFVRKVLRVHFEDYIAKHGKRHRRHLRDEVFMQRREPISHDSTRPIRADAVMLKQALDELPKIFLHNQFSLTDCAFFYGLFVSPDDGISLHLPNNSNFLGPVVTEDSNNPFGEFEDASNFAKIPLKEKPQFLQQLSHYVDIVENQISRQIVSQSSAFFHAMASHDELQQYLAQTRQAVAILREKLASLSDAFVKHSLQMLQVERARSNSNKLQEKLKLMATVKETQPTVQMLLNSSDYLGALDLISTTQEVLHEELAGIVGFRHLGMQLSELQKVINKMLQEEFLTFVSTELANVPDGDDEIYFNDERFISLVLGLVKLHELRFIDVLKEECLVAVKNSLRNTVRGFIEDAVFNEDQAANSLGDQIRRLPYSEWLGLLTMTFANVLILGRKIKILQDILSELCDIVAQSALSPNSRSHASSSLQFLPISLADDHDITLTEEEQLTIREQVSSMSHKVFSVMQERCSRFVNARFKEGIVEKVGPDDFLNLLNLVEHFSKQCEELCGFSLSPLKSCMQTQASKFVQKFHDDKKTKLSLILDSEQWRQAEVPGRYQNMVDYILLNGELRKPSKFDRSDHPGRMPSFLSVNGEKFSVVGTAVIFHEILIEYCQHATDVAMMSKELLLKVIELLKSFNSRTCQLILGAGALQLVGLKTISTKNLALASRSLQLIVLYIPQIEKHFNRLLPDQISQISKHFTQVKKDYQDHIIEIDDQLFAVVRHNLVSSLKKWEPRPPVPSQSIQQICRYMKKLHENVVDILPLDQTEKLIKRCHQFFHESFRELLREYSINASSGASYSFVCSEFSYYMEHLHLIPCCSELKDSVCDVLSQRI